jgi:hypothetical protein
MMEATEEKEVVGRQLLRGVRRLVSGIESATGRRGPNGSLDHRHHTPSALGDMSSEEREGDGLCRAGRQLGDQVFARDGARARS